LEIKWKGGVGGDRELLVRRRGENMPETKKENPGEASP